MTENNEQRKRLNLDLDYFKTPAGQLRVAQGVLSLAALISAVEGECSNDTGRYGFFLCVVIITMVEAIFIIIVFLLHLHNKVQNVNVPLTLVMNDSITLLFHFISSTLSMLSIGRCHYKIEARIISTLFSISLFLVYIGLCYTDYMWWQTENISKDKNSNRSTTVTETSPTVLT